MQKANGAYHPQSPGFVCKLWLTGPGCFMFAREPRMGAERQRSYGIKFEVKEAKVNRGGKFNHIYSYCI